MGRGQSHERDAWVAARSCSRYFVCGRWGLAREELRSERRLRRLLEVEEEACLKKPNDLVST